MKTHRSLFLLVSVSLLLALVLAGCSTGDDAPGPPEIQYGVDVCDECNMIINEPRFAAAYHSEAGETRRFDDIGEMFLYAEEQGEAVQSDWVHDFNSEEWLKADSATFVYDPDLMTPMGWGIAAFAAETDATAYHDEHGATVLSYTELREQVLRGEIMPQGMAGQMHGSHK
ncbi:MAG: nitrous oxide reductase accessory protein NosL [Anaerolineae bacterium]|nr:nitrous oxide reductase accessory protein NosL [Anaerolineae bacterium]